MTRRNSIAAMKDEAAQWRRTLHQNPQTSYEEVFASDFIAGKLGEWGIPFKRGIAVTGIVATIEGRTNKSGQSVALRADIDALNIVEVPNKPWVSKTSGKMHGCGHDGHTAMMLGAAKYLSETRNFDGTVYLIFQPAEEGGAGAIKMIEEGLFKEFPANKVFGLHNWPMMPKGKIGMRPGPIMASADHFEIIIKGKGGHAAMPQFGVDPIIAASYIVTALQTIISRNVDPVDQGVVTVSNYNGGTGADNVIPDTVRLLGTVRAFKPATRDFIERRIGEISTHIAAAFGAKTDYHYTRGYDPTINSAAETEMCANIARKLFGEQNVMADVEPCMGAEDFGAMLVERPGCYIWMGQGTGNPESPHDHGLHNAAYDFNDDIIPMGVEYWAELVETALPAAK